MMLQPNATEINYDSKQIYQNYTFDPSTFNYTINNITSFNYTRVNRFTVAHSMARKIKEFDN